MCITGTHLQYTIKSNSVDVADAAANAATLHAQVHSDQTQSAGAEGQTLTASRPRGGSSKHF
jgi:hypothetical protein